MNKIDHKFLYYKTKTGFEREKHKISPDSIVFILDLLLIWTHNNFFGIHTGAEKAKGFFETFADLKRNYPQPEVGDWAIVLESGWKIAICKVSPIWQLSDITYQLSELDLSLYLKKEDVDLSKYVLSSELTNYLRISDLQNTGFVNSDSVANLIQLAINNLNFNNSVDNSLSVSSTNPVQNKVVTEALNDKASTQDVENAVTLLTNALNLKADKTQLSNYVLASNLLLILDQYLELISSTTEHAKGYWDSLQQLQTAIQSPEVGDWAVVAETNGWYVYKCTIAGTWERGPQFEQLQIDLSQYAKKDQVQTIAQSLADLRVLTEGLEDTVDNVEDRLEDVESELYEILNRYISWYQNGDDDPNDPNHTPGGHSSNMITLSDEDYQMLVNAGRVQEDTYYFTYSKEDYPDIWTFGHKFPIKFTEQWTFGGTFPITLQ